MTFFAISLGVLLLYSSNENKERFHIGKVFDLESKKEKQVSITVMKENDIENLLAKKIDCIEKETCIEKQLKFYVKELDPSFVGIREILSRYTNRVLDGTNQEELSDEILLKIIAQNNRSTFILASEILYNKGEDSFAKIFDYFDSLHIKNKQDIVYALFQSVGQEQLKNKILAKEFDGHLQQKNEFLKTLNRVSLNEQQLAKVSAQYCIDKRTYNGQREAIKMLYKRYQRILRKYPINRSC